MRVKCNSSVPNRAPDVLCLLHGDKMENCRFNQHLMYFVCYMAIRWRTVIEGLVHIDSLSIDMVYGADLLTSQ